MTSDFGLELRHSAADAYVRSARRPDLTVRTGAYAQRILLDGSRATGVEYGMRPV